MTTRVFDTLSISSSITPAGVRPMLPGSLLLLPAEGGGRRGRKRGGGGGGSAGLPYMAVEELYANIVLRGTASRFCRQSVVASRV
ncbi:hypothetical protein NQZ68_004901 [Dissostichus eleginoides]|nr:hypothetical protein NQZ68_004901 [Dissostichus eleginoides]